jgi:hypothetical protein
LARLINKFLEYFFVILCFIFLITPNSFNVLGLACLAVSARLSKHCFITVTSAVWGMEIKKEIPVTLQIFLRSVRGDKK